MKDEEDANVSTANNCLSSETYSYELEFIKTYEQLPVLWDVKHPDYTNKYRRGIAMGTLVKIMKKWNSAASLLTVRQKINVLRSAYRKDLRRHLSSKTIGPEGEEIFEYNPKNWKFYALKFLGGKLDEDCEHIKTSNIVEINLDNTNFEDEPSEESENDEPPAQSNKILQILGEDKSYQQSHDKESHKKKRMKLEVQESVIDIVDNSMLDREFEAIGSNVTCKLKRMNPEQRYHAELLINKVLIQGLKNNLTDDTDLTEVFK